MIRAELPGLDPENDIEVTIDGRVLTIRAERRHEDTGPCRSEFRYGSLAREVRLPARVDAADVTARYDKGVLEVSVPAAAVKSEGTRCPSQEHPARYPSSRPASPDEEPAGSGHGRVISSWTRTAARVS